MKKVVIFLILLALLLSGCGNNTEIPNVNSDGKSSESSSTSNKENSDMNEITFQEGVWSDKDWEKVEFPFEKDCIPDKETAVNVTKLFLGKFQQQNYFINYVPQSVFYDTEDKIWIVSFSEGDYPGADFTIAIRRENAEVVKMWVGE